MRRCQSYPTETNMSHNIARHSAQITEPDEQPNEARRSFRALAEARRAIRALRTLMDYATTPNWGGLRRLFRRLVPATMRSMTDIQAYVAKHDIDSAVGCETPANTSVNNIYGKSD
jgi:hypothetical protein